MPTREVSYRPMMDYGGSRVGDAGVFMAAHRRQPDGAWKIESVSLTTRDADPGGDAER